MRHTLCGNDGADIGKVAVDCVGVGDDITNALNTLAQNIVRNHESFTHGAFANYRDELLIRNDYQCIDNITQRANTADCGVCTVFSLKFKGLSNHCDG